MSAPNVQVTAQRARPLSGLSPNARAYIALGLGAICIGFSAIFTKWAGVSGPVSAFYRVLIATTVLGIPYLIQNTRQRRRAGDEHKGLSKGAFGLIALAATFFVLDLGFWNTSLNFTNAANSTLLGNTSTIWVSFGAMLLFRQKLAQQFWFGLALAVVGAITVVGPDLEHAHLGLGDLLAVGSSLFYSGYLLTTQRVRNSVGTLQFMWLSSAIGTVLLLGYVLLIGERLFGYSTDQYLSLLALGLISHALGWMLINYALGHLPAPIASVTLLAQPVFTAIAAVPLLGEGLSAYQMGGGVLVLVGIYIVNRR